MPKRAIYYDTETTGFRSERDRIIELAAYDPEQQRSFVKLINPGIPIPKETTAIHNITDEMVASAPSFGEIAREFIEFCSGDVILIAHNNDTFDLLFLKAEFERANTTMPEWSFLDSLKWARRYRPDLPRHTLQFLREIYGFPANNAHRALDDVIVLHQIFKSMTDDLHIEQVQALLQRPKEIRSMPFGKYVGKPLAAVPQDYIKWLTTSGALDKPENHELRAALAAIKS